jgi:signal transduction histidine kinase
MGDLHDGVAGNLITIQALTDVYDPKSKGEINALSKRALLDLRLVVDSLENFEGDLIAVLSALKERLTPWHSSTPLRVQWDWRNAPTLEKLRPEVNLSIFRIVQESIANSMQHGHADRIHIIVRAAKSPDYKAEIWILDNGKSGAKRPPGFGLQNMRRRAALMDGKLYFRFTTAGSGVLLMLRA